MAAKTVANAAKKTTAKVAATKGKAAPAKKAKTAKKATPAKAAKPKKEKKEMTKKQKLGIVAGVGALVAIIGTAIKGAHDKNAAYDAGLSANIDEHLAQMQAQQQNDQDQNDQDQN